MKNRLRSPYVLAVLIALAVINISVLFKFVLDEPFAPPRIPPVLKEPGSVHSHTSLLVMVGNRSVSFCAPAYMLRSQAVHFENNNCFVVHKHSKGVTLQTFFESIGVVLNDQCLTIPNEGNFCTNGKNVLRVILNGEEIPTSELAYYELKNNDHVLVNYGFESGALLRFKYNQVPMIHWISMSPPRSNNGSTKT